MGWGPGPFPRRLAPHSDAAQALALLQPQHWFSLLSWKGKVCNISLASFSHGAGEFYSPTFTHFLYALRLSLQFFLSAFFSFLNIYLCVYFWLHRVLVVAHGLFAAACRLRSFCARAQLPCPLFFTVSQSLFRFMVMLSNISSSATPSPPALSLSQHQDLFQ